MNYTVERIRELAAMACVSLTESEANTLCRELDAMREIAETLRGASDLPDPFFGAVGLDDMREDVPQEGLSREVVLRLSPCVKGDSTVVPRTVEG